MGTKGTSGSSVRNQLQPLRSGKCRWIEHSWRVSGKWEKPRTGPVEVVTGVTAPRQPLVTELYVTNYRTNVTADTQKSNRGRWETFHCCAYLVKLQGPGVKYSYIKVLSYSHSRVLVFLYFYQGSGEFRFNTTHCQTSQVFF